MTPSPNEPSAPQSTVMPRPSSHSEFSFFELSALIYRDITLADAKAAFSLTVAGLGIAGSASFYGSMPDPASRFNALSNLFVSIPLFSGVLCALGGIFCAIVTVLPRRYVDDKCVMRALEGVAPTDGLWQDAKLCFSRNLPGYTAPKRDSDPIDGGTYGIRQIILAYKAKSEAEQSVVLFNDLQRCSVVRERKYWWVGPSLVLTALAVGLFTVSLVMGAVIVTNAGANTLPVEVRVVK
jgi:hypothetical protein